MKTIRSCDCFQFGPLALALAFFALTVLRAYSDGSAPREPLAAAKVTAELARAASYGLVDADAGRTASVVRQVVAPTASAPQPSST